MKKTKKLISLLMALAMIFALAIPAFAETTGTGTDSAGDGAGSITITNPVEGETYSAYQMLVLSYNETTKSYSYTIADGWESFFNSSSYFTVDSNGYVTSEYDSNSSGIAAAAKAALAYAEENIIEPVASVTADSTGATITGLELGYYLVDTTLGTLCSIDSTDTTATIYEKNSDVPTDTKTVSSDGETYNESNSASIGDTVYFKVELGNLANKSNVSLTDTMSAGLTLDTTSIEVCVGTTKATVDSDYTISATASGYTITFKDSYLATLEKTEVVTVTYSATINENAVIGVDGNTNKAILSYGDSQSTSDTTKTYVYGIDIYKYTTNSDEKVALSGAEFVLYKTVEETGENDTVTNVPCYAVVNDGNLTGWTTTEANATKLTSDTDGKISVDGLAAGTYYLVETEAPVGYNKLSGEITVVINENGDVTYSYGEVTNATGTIEVENKAGTELPSTGGMGTTLFYIFGGALVLCAVVLLVTRRRMDNEQ